MIDWITSNSEMILTFGVVIAVILIGFIVVPKLREKGFLKDEDISFTKQLLEIAGLILAEVKFKDEDAKQNSITVIKIAETAVKYVSEIMVNSSIQEKKGIAVLTSLQALKSLGIEATEAKKRIIEITVEAILSRMEK